jgi:hypothetical protein
MACKKTELPYEYTEADVNPPLFVAFSFDISTHQEIVAIVERPDDTVFERAGSVINPHQVQFAWTATDWIKGCSTLTIRLKNSAGEISHVKPVTVRTRDKPPVATP